LNISPIKFSQTIEALLQSEDLPTADLLDSDKVKLFGFERGEKLAGVVGLELQEEVGLLRSLAVDCDFRKSGYGEKLVAYAESWAKENGVSQLYLLTVTADTFFQKLGYTSLARDEAPAFIAETPQFSGLCSSAATLMYKALKMG